MAQATNRTTDHIGQIAKWLDEAREAGSDSRDIAEMLVEGAAIGLHIRGKNSDREDVARRLADQLGERGQDNDNE